MTYSPNPLNHLALSDRAALFCSSDAEYCTEASPCRCCTPPAPAPKEKKTAAVETEATPQADVQFKSDGDFGIAGESHG